MARMALNASAGPAKTPTVSSAGVGDELGLALGEGVVGTLGVAAVVGAEDPEEVVPAPFPRKKPMRATTSTRAANAAAMTNSAVASAGLRDLTPVRSPVPSCPGCG